MPNYLVFMPGGEERLEETFTDRYRLTDGLWAVSSQMKTSSEVCSQLGIDDQTNMVVVPMNGYYGRFDKALWQRLESWREK